jgi:hypothetical protein
VYRAIAGKMPWPAWAMKDARYRRLATYAKLLDGTFYDHLTFPFHQEFDQSRRYISVYERRPSVRYPLLEEIAVALARKLWAGGHFPKFVHDSDRLIEAIDALVDEGQLVNIMLDVSEKAAVGSAAVTFQILNGKLLYHVWPAHHCRPIFASNGDLAVLRVQYVTSGADLLERGITWAVNNLQAFGGANRQRQEPIKADQSYWFVQDFGAQADVVYYPFEQTEWDPTQGSTALIPIDKPWSDPHAMGFVKGVWIKNVGGVWPDGKPMWPPGVIDTAINLDYTLSLLGRGIWYNSAPQVVLKGELLNQEDLGPGGVRFNRGPANMLQIPMDKDDGGEKTSNADIKLLEMRGQWIQYALEYVRQERMVALEGAHASRKDPDAIKGQMTGRAMQLIEDDVTDHIHETRNSHGTYGILPLIRKTILAAKIVRHPAVANVSVRSLDELQLQWPLPFSPDPTDLQVFTTTLTVAEAQGYIDNATAGMMFRNYADAPEPEPGEEPGGGNAPVRSNRSRARLARSARSDTGNRPATPNGEVRT